MERKTITLCGSTRFKKYFEHANAHLTKKGFLVFSCAIWGHSGDEITEEEKNHLDEVHLSKIDKSDIVFVVDIDHYIGASTKKEIEYAKSKGIEVIRWSSPASLDKLDNPFK